jgi:ribosomal protein S17E
MSNAVNAYKLHAANQGHQRQEKNQNATKEGVLVNNFIKTDFGAPLYVPHDTSMPDDLTKDNTKKPNILRDNPLIPLMAAPIAILGVGALLSVIHKQSIAQKRTIPDAEQVQSIGRMISMNDDNIMVQYLLIQDPSPKALIAATAVLAVSGTTLIMRNFVDGFKEIWVKKQKAEIQRDLEESLIEIETRSFSGKIKILRNMIAKYAVDLNPTCKVHSNYCPTFTGYNKDIFVPFNSNYNKSQPKKPEKKKFTDTNAFYLIAGITTLAVSTALAVKMFKNLGSAKKIQDDLTKEVSEKLTETFIKTPKEEFEQNLKKMPLNDIGKKFLYKEWCKANNVTDPVFVGAPEFLGGIQNKVSFTSIVSDKTAFLYTYIMNPTPQTRNLMILTASTGASGYIGQSAVAAVKEVQVEKANAETERQLQDKLVQVELNNFLAKKTSYMEPLVKDYIKYKNENPDKIDNVEKMYINIIEEAKSGPPFVYT